MSRPLRTTLAALSLIAATVSANVAHAAPPDTEPEGPPPTTDPHPLPAQGSDPKNGEAPAAIPPSNVSQPPPSNRPRNPIDALPGDVVFPRLNKSPNTPILWKPEWARFQTTDWVITGAGVVIALAGEIIPPLKKHFVQTFGIDDSVRNALRLDTAQQRYDARDASDVLLSLEVTWPLFVDATISTWWYRSSPDAAAQMALVDGEALSLTIAAQSMSTVLTSRERPYGQSCGSTDKNIGPPDQTQDCQGNSRYRSFFSGHTAFSFVSAGLICTHHEKLKLYGGGFPDHLACAIALTGATATGVLRIAGDMHYVTDVGIGAAVGTLFGVGIPLLHYRSVNKPSKDGATVEVMPVGQGIGLGGTF